MVMIFTIAGLVEAQVCKSSAQLASILSGGRQVYWLVRTLSGSHSRGAFFCFFLGLLSLPGPRSSQGHITPVTSREVQKSTSHRGRPGAASHESSFPTACFSHAQCKSPSGQVWVFLRISFLVIAILPWKRKANEISAGSVPPWAMLNRRPKTKRQSHLRRRTDAPTVHTQQIRSLCGDCARFGAPTARHGRTKYDTAALGQRADRARFVARIHLHPRDWQLTHLYNPGSSGAIRFMPPYLAFQRPALIRPHKKEWIWLPYCRLLDVLETFRGFERQPLLSSVASGRTPGYGHAEASLQPQSHSSSVRLP